VKKVKNHWSSTIDTQDNSYKEILTSNFHKARADVTKTRRSVGMYSQRNNAKIHPQ